MNKVERARIELLIDGSDDTNAAALDAYAAAIRDEERARAEELAEAAGGLIEQITLEWPAANKLRAALTRYRATPAR